MTDGLRDRSRLLLEQLVKQWRSEGFDSARYADELAALLAVPPPQEAPKDWEVARSMLWQNHGCPFSALYGDDGEMQCNNAARHGLLDFKRDAWDALKIQLLNAALAVPREPDPPQEN